jgi:hypothetical protein
MEHLYHACNGRINAPCRSIVANVAWEVVEQRYDRARKAFAALG